MSVYGNLQRNRKSYELRKVLRTDKSDKEKKKKNQKDDSENAKQSELSADARRRLKNIEAKKKLSHLLEKKRDNTFVRVPEISKNLLNRSTVSQTKGIIDGKDLINSGILIYGIAEGATGTIQDFDAILDALKNDIFLSKEFNPNGQLRPYKLDEKGIPKYKGGGKGKYEADDIVKAAKKFKGKAKLIKSLKFLGSAANILGLFMTIEESLKNGEITVLEAMDVVMGVIAFVPGYGWIISGTWSIMRLTIPTDAGNYGIEMDNGIRRFGEW